MLINGTGDAPTDRQKVAVFTPNFIAPPSLRFDPKNCLWGGGERYLIDLCRLLRSAGMDPCIYQPSGARWEGYVYGFPIYGLGDAQGRDALGFWPAATAQFDKHVAPLYKHVIYFNLDLIASTSRGDSIGVTHGVYWDGVGRWRTGGGDKPSAEFDKRLKAAHETPELVVSVDTNSINWARAEYGMETAGRMRYVPNYADEDLYHPGPKPILQPDAIPTVIVSRRPTPLRGTKEAIGAADRIVSEREVNFRFVGRGDMSADVSALVRKHPARVSSGVVEMVGMEEEYRKADISIIPTLACEGTSLSAIESMASGLLVIATWVGGLSDLIVGGFNGLLIPPTEDALERAILWALDHPEESRTMAERGASTFENSFGKRRWEERWMDVLMEMKWIASRR